MGLHRYSIRFCTFERKPRFVEHDAIDLTLKHRWLVLVATLALLGAGGYALYTIPVEAFPDVQDVQVQVITQVQGQAPEEVETPAVVARREELVRLSEALPDHGLRYLARHREARLAHPTLGLWVRHA